MRLLNGMGLLALLVSGAGYTYAYAASTECVTQAAGTTFRGLDPSELWARSSAVQQCKSDPRTLHDRYACDRNVVCRSATTPTYPSPGTGGLITCTTSTRGVGFQESRPSEYEARQIATSRCVTSYGSDVSECQRNLVCRGASSGPTPYPPAPTLCRASSRGYTFEGPTPPIAIAACKASPYTSNLECESTAYCTSVGGGYPRPDACETSSNGLSFTAPIAEAAIATCKAHPRTFNSDCERNVFCRGGTGPSLPPPPPPRPRIPLGIARITARVDGLDYLEIRGTQVVPVAATHQPTQLLLASVSSPLPRRPVDVVVNKLRGRGSVEARPVGAGDTLQVTVDDKSSGGSDIYEVEILWFDPLDRPRR